MHRTDLIDDVGGEVAVPGSAPIYARLAGFFGRDPAK